MKTKTPLCYSKRLKALLTSQGAAYGFTLTIWSTGTLAREHYGHFSVDRIFLFVLGPLVMYASLLIILYRPSQPPVQISEIHYTPFSFMDFISVPFAVATAYLVYTYIPWPLWGIPVGSFLATLVYNLLLATQFLFFNRKY
jgi:hypothetical protein